MKHLDYQRQDQWQNPTNILCQSPISLKKSSSTNMKGQLVLINFHQVIMIKDQIVGQQFMSQGDLDIFGIKWQLERFHFHEHSEHRIENNYYDIEVHFVFKNNTSILVVAVLGNVNKYSQSKFVELFENNYAQFELASIFPKKSNYYSYQGSLTTPPFDQSVQWLVMADPIEISFADLVAIKESYPNNYRQEQPLKKRKINYHITP